MRFLAGVVLMLATPAMGQTVIGGPDTSTAAMEIARDAADLKSCVIATLYSTRQPELCTGTIASACRADPVTCNTREAAAWARLVEDSAAEMRQMIAEGSTAFSIPPQGAEAVALFDASQAAYLAARDTDCALEAMVWRDANTTLRCRVRHDAGRAIALITRMSP